MNLHNIIAWMLRGDIMVVYLVLTLSSLFIIINLFYVIGLFLNPLRTSGFFLFSEGIERDQWHEIS